MTSAASVKEAYEREQEKLRHEGNLEDDDSSFPLPQEPEVDPRVYKSVEPLLFRGFLALPATLGDNLRVVYKSLNHHEYERLQLTHGSRDTDFYVDFLAQSTYLLGGQNVLSWEHREKVKRFYGEVPPPLRNRILTTLSELNRQASDGVRLVEAYAMETLSRLRWVQLYGLDLTSTAVTGVEGSSLLGYNWGQLLWRALNRYQDTREDMDRHWENAKFIGGCFAGKGINKVHNQDRRRKREEIENRIARKDQILREVVLLEKSPERRVMRDGHVVKSAQTTEELATQLEQSLKGEEDFHDRVVRAVEEYHAKVRVDREAELQRLYDEAASKAQGQGLTGIVDRKGLSREEVEQRIARTRAIMAQGTAQRMVRPPPPSENPYERFRQAPEQSEQSEQSEPGSPKGEVRPLPPLRSRLWQRTLRF